MEQVTKLNNEYDIRVQQYIVQACTDQNSMKLNVIFIVMVLPWYYNQVSYSEVAVL